MSQLVFLALLVAAVVVAALGVGAYIYGNIYASAGPRTRRWLRLGLPARPAGRALAGFREGLRRRAARRAKPSLVFQWDPITEIHGDDEVTFVRGIQGAWEVAERHQRALWEARERAANGGAELQSIAITHAPAWATEAGYTQEPLGDRPFARAVAAVVTTPDQDAVTQKLQAVMDSTPEARALVVASAIERGDEHAKPAEHVGATAGWSPLDETEAAGESLEGWWSRRLQEYDEALARIDAMPRRADGAGAFVILGQTTAESLASLVEGSQHLHAYRMLRIGMTGELPLVREKVAA